MSRAVAERAGLRGRWRSVEELRDSDSGVLLPRGLVTRTRLSTGARMTVSASCYCALLEGNTL